MSEILPFRVNVNLDVIEDLCDRLQQTRWPDQIPDIAWSQGAELSWTRQLTSHWANDFDWRAWQDKINRFDHFMWEGIHFIYRRSRSGKGTPIILTHGWPSSFLEYLEVLPLLEDFDVVIPSLPGYGFSPRPLQVGINYRYVAERWNSLMKRLGYRRYSAGGGDFGAGVATFLAIDYPTRVLGIHLTTPELLPDIGGESCSEEKKNISLSGPSGIKVSAAIVQFNPRSHRRLAMR